MSKTLDEILDKYLREGSNIFVRGPLKTCSWNDKNGNKCYSAEIQIKDLTSLGVKKEIKLSGNYR